jgi:hypothetical protein
MTTRSARNASAAGHLFGPLIRSPSTLTLDQPTRMSLTSLSGPSASTTLPFSIPTATRKPPTPPAIRTTRTTSAMSPRRLPLPATILNRFRYADPVAAAMPRSRSHAARPRAHAPSAGDIFLPRQTYCPIVCHWSFTFAEETHSGSGMTKKIESASTLDQGVWTEDRGDVLALVARRHLHRGGSPRRPEESAKVPGDPEPPRIRRDRTIVSKTSQKG